MKKKRATSSLLAGSLVLVGFLFLVAALVTTSWNQAELPSSVAPTIAVLKRELEQARRQHRQAEETTRQLQQTIQSLRRTGGSAPPDLDEAEQVDRERAIEIATSYLGGGTVVEVEQEREHGSLVYEVTFANENKVYVEVASGRVVYARIRDTDGEEDEEDEEDKEDEEDEEEDDD